MFAYLTQTDEAACRNAGAVLQKWVGQYGSDNARAALLAENMVKGFGGFSPAGRVVVLETALVEWFGPTAQLADGSVDCRKCELIAEVAKSAEPQVHAAGLNLRSLALIEPTTPR